MPPSCWLPHHHSPPPSPPSLSPEQGWDTAPFGDLPHLALVSSTRYHLRTVSPKRKCNGTAESCILQGKEK